jgi:predicted ATPase/class 3 adenylate cyclase
MPRALPTGTVTFLFTDVEGSTALLHELGPVGFAEALAEHRRVLREAVAGEGGVEVDTQGDAFFFVFPTAPGAVRAAAAAVEQLAAGMIRIRVGIHTGTPHVTDEGYVGDDVHLGARVTAAGHGGQVVLTKATRDLLDGEAIRDLGEHRLKDFAEPVWIYQLGRETFPPLRTISNTNLPRPASSFVGRGHEVEEVADRLRAARLVTLTGPGGSGKTRLAIEAAAELVPEFRNGVFWVGLAALRDSGLVLPTIAHTLGAKNGAADHIGDRELLLLLDNLEQVIESAPDLLALVETCPNLKLLVTSRERMRVPGEVEYPVLPLAETEAVELFAARSGLEPDETVAVLCSRLDNLPLAVELAAARTSVLSPAQIAARLAARLDLLKAGRGVDPRQQTLRATIEWSHDLLSADEQRLFARLAVFAGGCTLDGAERVCDAELDTLQALVDKSLVRHTQERFWMLETIREYAAERLERSGETEKLRRRHAENLLERVKEAQPHLTGANQAEWLTGLDAERDNIRATLGWGLARDPELALDIAATLDRFWWARDPAEALGWIERGLAVAGVAAVVRAPACAAAGAAAWFVGDVPLAERYFAEALALYRELGDREGVARMLIRLGPPLAATGRHDESEGVLREALALCRELELWDEVAIALQILGVNAHARGDPAHARPYLEEAVALGRRIRDFGGLVYSLSNLAEIELEQGNSSEARALAHEALTVGRRIGDDLATLVAISVLAVVAARLGEMRVAGNLWGAADRLDEVLGESMWRRERELYEDLLGERGVEFTSGFDEGRRMTVDEAVAVALALESG